MTQITDFPVPSGAQVTEVARRRARFKYAMDRVRKMAEGTPEFTPEELAELAAVFTAQAGRTSANQSRILAGELLRAEARCPACHPERQGPDPVTAPAARATVGQ